MHTDTYERRSYSGPRTPLLTVNEVARTLSISRTSVYELIGRGEITGFRLFGRLRFPEGEVEAFLERQAAKEAP